MINSNKTYTQFINQKAQQLRQQGVVQKSPSEYFGQIGSIPLEDIPYTDQLTIKKDAVLDIFSKSIDNGILEQLQITPSPKLYEYRFRMDYVCSYDPFHEGNNRFGQRKAGRFNWVIDMKTGVLIPEVWFGKVRSVYEKARALEIPLYDLVSHKGQLRYLVIRQQDDQGMLNIVIKHADEYTERSHDLCEYALSIGFTSVNLIEQPSISDASEGTVIQTYGAETIIAHIHDTKFHVGSHTFFQNNIPAFEEIVEFISPFIRNSSATHLIDLYAGVGTLGILFAQEFQNVYGYEINRESVRLAEKNIAHNTIENYTIVSADLSKTGVVTPQKDTLVIVDPPRTGLQEQGVQHVLLFSPETFVYISCNPVTQAQDLEAFLPYYEPIAIRSFDLFPHTYHVENVVILKRRK